MHARPIRFFTLLALLALAACTRSDLRPDYVRQASTVLPVKTDAPLAAYAMRLSELKGDESGLRLLGDSVDALVARIALADRAKYSIDVQYYMFHSDATGKLLAQHLLAAADRGVRIRVLLDDLHEAGNDTVLRALNGHDHIEIRLFNPMHERTGSVWGMGKQFATDFDRLNRRMHNKTYTADSAVSVIGGRNIGDEYFESAESVNFRDLDVMVIGPVVAEIGQSFDTYWNSAPSIPVDAFRHDPISPADLAALRKSLADNARKINEDQYAASVIATIGELGHEVAADKWDWGAATFLSDDPLKVDPSVSQEGRHMLPKIQQWLDTAQQRILLISPYFVPGDKGVAYLEQRRAAGVDVEVLTNSLASTDAGNVYAAYASYRPALLAAGVRLYELKPDAARADTAKRFIGSSSSGSSLHAKAMAIDDDETFVGSMNLDPRSGNLNTEDGVIVKSIAFNKALADIFVRATHPSVTYEVLLKPNKKTVYWQTEDDGKTVIYDDAPRTSAWRRTKAGMTRLLPIEGLL